MGCIANEISLTTDFLEALLYTAICTLENTPDSLLKPKPLRWAFRPESLVKGSCRVFFTNYR